MSEPVITLELPWDEATFLEGAKLAYDYDMRHSWRRYMGWFFIALTQFGVVAALLRGSIGLLLISTLLVIYWYGLRWPMRRRMLRRFFAGEERPGRLKITLSEEGICLDEACLPWEGFRRAILAPAGTLLEMGGGTFLYFPRRIVPDDEHWNRLAERLRKHIDRVVRFDESIPHTRRKI